MKQSAKRGSISQLNNPQGMPKMQLAVAFRRQTKKREELFRQEKTRRNKMTKTKENGPMRSQEPATQLLGTLLFPKISLTSLMTALMKASGTTGHQISMSKTLAALVEP